VPVCIFENDWTTLSLDLTGYRKANLYLGLQSNAFSEYILWDDVLFTTPAPMADFCASSPCQNGGNCTIPLYRYRYDCNCVEGYEGYNCEVEIFDECASNPCRNEGLCIDGILMYTCECRIEYALETFGTDDNCVAITGLVAYTSFALPGTGAPHAGSNRMRKSCKTRLIIWLPLQAPRAIFQQRR
jgi:hypothetical protein